MRIGMLADIYKPHVSGVTNAIDLLRKHLKARGHDVFVFTFGKPQANDECEGVIRSSGIPMPIRQPHIQLSFRYSEKAKARIKSLDVVHVHHPFLSGQLALRYAQPEGIPILFTNHTRYDLYAKAYMPMLPDQIGTSFLHSYLPAYCREINLVIAPSEGIRKVLRELGVDSEITVIPNGVELEPFRRASQPAKRSKFGFSKEDIVLVYAGRMGPEKNLMFLLRTFAGLHQAYNKVRLLMVGHGPEYDNIADFVTRNGLDEVVQLTGLVPYEDMPNYLASADVFVTPSVTEVHPLSVIEALAVGLPVVGIKSPGVGDIVNHRENGLLSEQDLASFASMLSRVISDHELRQQLSQGAAESANQFDIERAVDQMERVYQKEIEHTEVKPKSFWRALRAGVRKVFS